MTDAAGEFERRHGAPELVRLAGREAGALDGDPHRLFLEQGHAQGLSEHLLQFGFRIVHGLLSLPAAEIGMDHVALDRAGANDRDLDDQVVEGARLDPREHGHLRPALDLENAEGVGLADHRIGARILGRDGGEVEVDPLVRPQKVQPPLHAAHHAQRETIDLHEFQRVDVVLVPLDHLTILHRRRFDGNQFVETVMGQDEAAGMLAEVAGRALKLAGELKRQS